MRDLGILLANELDPPDLDQAQEWYRKAIAAGNTECMRDLGILLAERLDPPDLDGAQEWYRKAIAAGNTDAMVDLGDLRSRQGDKAGAVDAWRRALVSRRGSRESIASARFALAALEALDGHKDEARALLDDVKASGFAIAAHCASLLSRDEAARAKARETLAAHEGDTDALNFLGLAAHEAGDVSAARTYWKKSAAARDTVAPLLVHLTNGG
jgi:TPR repeat protein